MIVGMQAQGFDIEIRQDGASWRARFYPSGLAHSIIYGDATEPTPWTAAQRAAWAALNATQNGKS